MTTRPTLPQNFIASDGVASVLDATFKDVTKWTAADATIESDTSAYINSPNAIKLTGTVAGGTATASLGANGDFLPEFQIEGGRWITFDAYIVDASAVQYIKFFASAHATSWSFADSIYWTANGTYLRDGWNHIRFSVSDFTVQGTSSLAVLMKKIRFQVVQNTGKLAVVTFDNLRFGQLSNAAVMLTFDDNFATQYTVAYPYMKAKGMKGTLMSNSGNITGTGIRMSLAQAQEMYADGWCIANHTANHVDLTTASDETITSEIVSMQEYLIENDMPRGVYVGAYPYNNHNEHVETVCASLGMLAMRCGTALGFGSQQAPASPLVYPFDMMRLGTSFVCDVLIAGSTLANAKLAVDNAMKNNAILVIMMHTFVESPSLVGEWTIADFQALIDYIYVKNLRTITLDEFYYGLTNPRYRSLPVTRATV